jgi:uncharacterized protein (TIGR02757 family)
MRMNSGTKKNSKPFTKNELKELLEEKADLYNRYSFIETDPISIPHRFTKKEDIEIAAFLTATIAWGQRFTLIKNANYLLDNMDNTPFDFITSFTKKDLKPFETFVHRTFNHVDCIFFLNAMQRLYKEFGSLEAAFQTEGSEVKNGIIAFRSRFLGNNAPQRTSRHVADPSAGSAAKRINMFLRWMVRKDERKIDFGIWNVFNSSQLYCPLDVHSGGVALKLGILDRKQDDWKAVEELTANLRIFDAVDPVKYDYALFGLGAFEGFRKD